MRHSVDRITIAGFKSIREVDLQPRELNILIGANGSGKSNFIGVFKLLHNMVEGRLQRFVVEAGGADRLLHYGSKVTEEISLKVAFSDEVNGYECTLGPTQEDALFFIRESCWFHDKSYDKPYTHFLGSNHDESLLPKKAERGIPRYVVNAFRSWRLYHFHDTSDTAKIKKIGDVDDNRALRPDAGNLAAFLHRLQETDTKNYSNIVDTIRGVAPFFDDFVLEPLARNKGKIKLEWREVDSDSYFDASSLSDGTLRFICLATLLLQPTYPDTILLDEPELGQHPHAIQVLGELLRSAATKTQVILSTQSVTLVNQFEPQDIIVVERKGQESVFKNASELDMEAWLEDYGLGDLWEKNLLGGTP